jgi:hypothetical protein
VSWEYFIFYILELEGVEVRPFLRYGKVRRKEGIDKGISRFKEKGYYKPAIREVRSDIFQISVSHIINCEDEEMVIFVDAFLNIVVEPTSLFLVRFLDCLALVNDLCAFGDGHIG